MGEPAARLNDMCTGHGCFPPRKNISASNNVFINGRGAVRVGDQWEVHCCDDSCHSSQQAVGSRSVFVNAQPLARVGDMIMCGSRVATGSGDVFAG